MLKSVVLLTTLCCFCLSHQARFQELSAPEQTSKTGTPKKSSPRKPAQLDQQSALMLLQELYDVADKAQTWDDAASAARAQAQVADLSWTIDATRASKYLAIAWVTTERIKEDPTAASQFKSDDRLQMTVRSELLSIAKKRIPELAQKWIEQIKEDADGGQQKSKPGKFDNRTQRSALLLQSALQSVDVDPQKAAEMAIESLADGISFDLRPVLLRLQEKDFNLAQRVFRAAVARLRTMGMRDPNELLILHAYLYTPNRVSATNTADNQNSRVVAMDRSQGRVEPAAKINPEMASEFLSVACDLLLSAPAPSLANNPQIEARAQISTIQVLLGAVSQRFPSQAVLLQARLRQLINEANFNQPSSSSNHRSGETVTDLREQKIKDLEEQAARDPNPLRRDLLYAKAAVAILPDDYQRGLGLAGKISDKELQSTVSNWLIYRGVIRLINAGDLVSAQHLNLKNSDLSQRAACMVLTAQKLVQLKNFLQAKRWLQDTRNLLLRAEPSEAAARVALGVVATYGKFDRILALEALMDTVTLINKSPIAVKDVDAAPLSLPFVGFSGANVSRGITGFGFSAVTSVFGSDQLVEVADVLRNIKRPEIRGMMLLALCRQKQDKIIQALKLNEPEGNSASLPSK